MALAPPLWADLCHVDGDAVPGGDGISWASAYDDLQAALADIGCTEIWVAAGLYKPGTATTDTFQLQSGVALYGGFAGTESSLDERDVAANVTVLSGDVGNDDITDANGVVADPGDQNGTGGQVGDNAEHVVTAAGTDATAVLDGFTITAGHGDQGAGLYNVGGSPTLAHLTFRGNRSRWGVNLGGGAGLYNEGSASEPVEMAATNLVFRNNFARDGAGIMNFPYTTIALTGSTFRDNVATSRGGAIASFGLVDLTVTGSTLHDNAASEGGAIFSVSLSFFATPPGSLTVTDSTFRRNQAFDSAGAIHARGLDVTVRSSTFEENRAESQAGSSGDGGAIYMELFLAGAERAGGLFLTNTTFSENYARYQGGAIVVTCEDVILGADAIQMNHLTFRFNDVGLQGRGGALANLDDQIGSGGGCFDFGINNSILWLNRFDSEIYNDSLLAKPVIRNSIVWRSFGSGPGWNDAYGHDGGGNLDAHPWFDHLGDRGGPTETIAIRPTSFAIDTADPAFCPSTDQRGVPRLQDGDGDGVPSCDMGAFEVVLPTPVLGSPVGSSTGTSPIPVTIDFDLPVEEFDVSDLVVGNGTAGNFAGSGDSYTVEITPDGEGMVTVDVPFGAGQWPPGGWFEDDTEPSQGHASIAAAQLSILFDGTPPGATLATTAPDPTNVAPIPVTITFSEPVTGFDVGDLTVTGGTAGNFAGSGDSYSVDITPTADGTVTLDLASGAAADAAGHGNTAAAQLAIAYDGTAPAPVIATTASDPTNTAPIPVTITFAEPVVGFELVDLSVTNGTAGNFAGSADSYSVDITSTADGTVTVDVGAGAAADAAGNSSQAAQLAIGFDTTAPEVMLATPAADPTNLSPIPVTIAFTEPVVGFELADLGVTNGMAGNFAGSGDSYTVEITPSADGLVTVDLAAGAAGDAAGNPSTAAVQLTIAYDGTPPTVALATAADDPTNVSPIPVSVTFSEPVTGFELADLAVTGGTAGNLAGSGDSYTLDLTPDADGTVTVEVGPGVAGDAAGNDNLAASPLSLTFDGTAPTVIGTSLVSTYGESGPGEFDIVFSESMSDPPGDGDADDVTNTANYLLVGAGDDGSFETLSCASGVAASDLPVDLVAVTWQPSTTTATIWLGRGPGIGSYRLFVCGTTSLEDLAGNELNAGADALFDFQVVTSVAIPTLRPSALALLVLLLSVAGSRCTRSFGDT